ncbi:MAG: acyl-CoA/acyl-ACP dehydrogenase [Planctomycetaceae bacterium]|nr:acyl-CoA/acyl-ACP dehydrogenase [Planctomycetaceae bacterium]
MEFGLSQEQTLLQDSVVQYLNGAAPLDRIKRFVNNCEPRADDVWSGMVDLGIPSLIIAEEHGGIGCELLDAALVAESLGSCAAPVPFAATAVMVPWAIAEAGSDEQQLRWLPKLAEGEVIAGAAVTEAISTRLDAGVHANGDTLSGRALFAIDFEADVYLIADRDLSLYLVDADASGLRRRPLTTIDKTRRYGELVFENVQADRLPGSSDPEVCRRVIDAGRIILAADTLGASQRMLNKAVNYSKERMQFGRPIGSFQAVKHMCAEMAAQLEPCRAMMWYAAHAFDARPEEARLTICHTKSHLSEVGKFIARTSTEVHGGIGFTDELGLHYWFKRIGANRQLLGGPTQLREEAAMRQGLVEA